MSGAATGTRPHWSLGRQLAQQAARPGRDAGALSPRLFGAVAGGLLATLSFPPYDLWPLAVPAVTLLVLVCRWQRPQRAALLGLAFGLTLFLPLLDWMRVIGVDAWLALALLEAGGYALMAALLPLVLRLKGWPVWVAGLWVAQELARATVPFGGFPWGRLAFGQTTSPYLPWAAVGGAPLVTFAVALSGSLLALAVVCRGRGVPAVALAVAGAVAVPLLAMLVPLPTGGSPVTAAVVQGSVPGEGLDFAGEREEVLRRHVAATDRLAAAVARGAVPAPDLVVWPENASDIDPFREPAAGALIQRAVDKVGVPVLVGAVLDGPGPDHVSNAGIVWAPATGAGERYVKRHPVPFGEYIPFRAQLSGLTDRLDQIPRDFFAGDRPGLLDVGPARVGDVICFEVAYDGLIRDVVSGGAQVLVVQTNNATYNGTGQPAQQLAMSRLRAVEYGRAVLVASTSGLSAVVGPDGRLDARTAEREARTLVRTVALRDDDTAAARVGRPLEWLLAGLGLGAAALGGLAARRERSRA